MLETPVTLVAAPTGSTKSTLMRTAAVRYVLEHPEQSVVFLIDRHKLGSEQIKALRDEHPNANFSAAIWRGRHADDPEAPDPKRPDKFLKMCLRSEEAKEVEKGMLSVDHHLCKQGRGENAVKCPLFDVCGHQRQKLITADIWFAAHECMAHEMPKAFGNVGLLLIDESPLDALMFGIEVNDRVELALDALHDPPPPGLSRGDAAFLRNERNDLYRAFEKLECPSDPSKGAPVPASALRAFAAWHTPQRNVVLEWCDKVVPDITPDMSAGQVLDALELAKGNAAVAKRVLLWQLVAGAVRAWPTIEIHRKGRGWSLWQPPVDAAIAAEVCGRIQLHRSRDGGGRVIRMVGVRQLAAGWQGVPILICDASGDARLLRAIWPQLQAGEWPQLPRPASVRILQVVDSAFAKRMIAVEGKDLETKAKAALRMYAAVLYTALQYGGADVGLITYKSTKEWILENCFVPGWLKLAHYGAATGTNAFENVRALFEVGRPQPPPEAMARMAEALFGTFVGERNYVPGRGVIPIEPDAEGHTAVEVSLHRHRHPMVHRLLRQAREWGLMQAEGRARAGRRSAEAPLDIHRWHDVPLPELGPVIMQRRDDVLAGALDALMLASEGGWLENIADAVRAYEQRELFTAEALKKSRQRRGVGTSPIGYPIGNVPTPPLLQSPIVHVTYQRRGGGCKPARAIFMAGVTNPREWLEKKLGPLVRYKEGWDGR